MITPEDAADIARRLALRYDGVEAEIYRDLAKTLAKYLAASDFRGKATMALPAFRRRVQRIVRALQGGTADEVQQAITEAWTLGGEAAAVETGVPFKIGPVRPAIEALAGELVGVLEGTTKRILRSSEDIYRAVVAAASGDVLGAERTRRTACQAAIDRFATRGITGFEDQLGRSWSLSSYTEMAIRSATGRACIEGSLTGYQDAGEDLVIVTNSPGECEMCRPWEGKVCSISGRSSQYPPLDRARGEGLFHANCKHGISLYQPGVTRPMADTEDAGGNEARVHQRYLERGIRSWKMREAAAIDDIAAAKAKAKVRAWQARLREHVRKHDLKRLRYRESIAAEKKLKGLGPARKPPFRLDEHGNWVGKARCTQVPVSEFMGFRERNEIPEMLTPHDKQWYIDNKVRCFKLPGLDAGYALYRDPDNERLVTLISVHNNTSVKVLGQPLVADAIRNGAVALDCYDGYLVRMYRKAGFGVVDRLKWDDDYKPKGWDYAKRGRPDVVFMRRRTQ